MTACDSCGSFERRARKPLASGAIQRARNRGGNVIPVYRRGRDKGAAIYPSALTLGFSSKQDSNTTYALHDCIQHNANSCTRIADFHVVIRIEAILYYGRENSVEEGARVLQDDNCVRIDAMVSKAEVEVVSDEQSIAARSARLWKLHLRHRMYGSRDHDLTAATRCAIPVKNDC